MLLLNIYLYLKKSKTINIFITKMGALGTYHYKLVVICENLEFVKQVLGNMWLYRESMNNHHAFHSNGLSDDDTMRASISKLQDDYLKTYSVRIWAIAKRDGENDDGLVIELIDQYN